MDEPNLATRENEFSEADSEALLRRYAPDEAIFRRVYNHSLTVKRHTLEFCRLLTPAHRVDHHLIILGSLLHDIGRFWCPPGDTGIMHGIVGARYLRAEHLYKCARIAERHLGVGIRREDILAQKLPLPIKDFVPLTVEERTICYIDNLVKGTVLRDEEWVVRRFTRALGASFESRVREFHRDMASLRDTE
jgi:uncharacterized protein